MTKIFISYSRSDEEFAVRLATSLSEAYADIWIDIEDIPAGMNWSTAIQQGLEACDLMIVIITPDSMDSRNVQDEWQFYLDQGKPVIPVLWRSVTKIHFQLNRLQYIDFNAQPYDHAVYRLNLELMRYGHGLLMSEPPDLDHTSVHAHGATLGSFVSRAQKETQTAQKKKTDLDQDTESETEPESHMTLYIVAGVLSVVAVLVILMLVSNLSSQPEPTPTTVVAVNATTAPTPTATVTESPSPTATERPTDTPTVATLIPATAFELTVQAEQNLILTDEALKAQAELLPTVQSSLTIEAAQTLTATAWTATPTPDARMTAAARLTMTARAERRDAFATARAVNQTATATQWTATPTPPAGYEGGPYIQTNDDWDPLFQQQADITMALVPTGCFTMGSDTGNREQRPAHEQCFDRPFWLDITEITRVHYVQCVDAGVCDVKPGNEFSFQQIQPVNGVTWMEAREYCEWRGGRLPTEAEWEYAARGPDNLAYPWGNNFNPDALAYNVDEARPVSNYPAGMSWVGAFDMLGNLWEWTSSQNMTYPYDPTDGREDLDVRDVDRILRGGAFTNDIFDPRFRIAENPQFAGVPAEIVGFRCAMDY